MNKLKIEYINTDKLIPYINNPRINDNAVDKVAGSISEFGFKNPIIVDKDNVIVAGHTRLLASRKLGLESIPIIRAEDLTDKQVKAFRIADNKTSEFAEWDMELLGIELEDLEDMFTGFTAEDLEKAFGEQKDTGYVDTGDLSDEISSKYEVIVEVKNEGEQEELFNKLQEEGYTCRVLIL